MRRRKRCFSFVILTARQIQYGGFRRHAQENVETLFVTEYAFYVYYIGTSQSKQLKQFKTILTSPVTQNLRTK